MTKYVLIRITKENILIQFPVDNFGTVVGENPTPYGILALWAVNGLSIVYWVGNIKATSKQYFVPNGKKINLL